MVFLWSYTEANNKFLKSYDANKLISYIIYLDANNLYGHSMAQLLPTEILVNPKDFNLDNCARDSPIGCFLEVDRDCPDELHDLRNYYPLAGEKIKRKELLSHYQLQVVK